MSERVPVTPETLRAAMRDPRYRSDAHPESAAFRGWVREGWQAFVAGGEGRTGVVQLRAHTRTRNGQPEQVGAHTRGGAAGEDITGAAAQQVSTTPAGTPPQPRPGGTAQSPTLVILIGGAGDSKNRNVAGFADTEIARRELRGREIAYFHHNEATAIARRIGSTPVGTRIVVVGHSWGGHTAATVSIAQARLGRPVDTPVTVDPVSWQASDEFLGQVRQATREWINIRAVPRFADPSDAVAVVGGTYANGPSRHATRHIEADATHRNFDGLLQWRDRDGVSALDRVVGR